MKNKTEHTLRDNKNKSKKTKRLRRYIGYLHLKQDCIHQLINTSMKQTITSRENNLSSTKISPSTEIKHTH